MRVANYFRASLHAHRHPIYVYIYMYIIYIYIYIYIYIWRDREREKKKKRAYRQTPTSGSLPEMNPDTCRQDDTKQVSVQILVLNGSFFL